MDWYTPSPKGDLGENDVIEPPHPYGDMFVANSHMMAVACWRYVPQQLYYYRVRQYLDPTPVDDLPGLFQCHSAVVIEKVHDGSGFNTDAGLRGPRWSDEELWPYVETSRWPDGGPMYDDQGHITDPPNAPSHELAQQLVQNLKEQRYRLPAFIYHHLNTIRGGPCGSGWPPVPWNAKR